MQGMDRHTGKLIDGWDYIFQCIDDLFTTRVRARVQRRQYGSSVPDAIDRPVNGDLILDVFVAAAEAIDKWLSTIVRLINIELLAATVDGKTRISVELERLDTNETNSFEVTL